MSMALEVPSLLNVRAEMARRHLHSFIPQAWHVVEPGKDFIGGFHIDAICDHLEAVINGHIKLLVINVPPRFTKSTIISVMLPVWSWINNPTLQWLTMSYNGGLATRDSVKSRRLLNSSWFKSMCDIWGLDLSLTSDQNQKQRYENNHMGYRVAMSIGGSPTGEGGDIILVDDPHNVKDGESEAVRKDTITTFREVIPSRLNDPDTGAICVIMQRVHFDDVTNEALTEMGYEHLNLPMEYDPKCIVDFKHKCSLTVEYKDVDGKDVTTDEGTSIGFKDPRTNAKELLCPERYSELNTARLKKQLTEYAWLSQYQQQPGSRKGGMFKAEHFTIVDVLPAPIKKCWRAWDKAGTKDGGARTAGVKMAELVNGMIAILDVEKGQWEAPEREKKIKKHAITDTRTVSISIEQEPGSGGKESAQATVRNLRGFRVKLDKVTGDKVVRAEPWATSVENGDVVVMRGPWNKSYITEHTQFPRGKFKDQVDASSQAHARIVGKVKVHI